MDQLTPISTRDARDAHDPAVLAFVKCHLSSFLRWDLLRLLADGERRWFDAAELARQLHKPLQTVELALDELEREGVLEAQHGPHGALAYRLDPQGPSTRVVERLVLAARRSHELREIIVARVVGEARVAS